MRFKIYSNGVLENVIVADEDFVKEYCSENGYTYEADDIQVQPEPAPIPAPEPTAQDDTDAMLIDHEYRLTLLELGLV